jgi:S-layer protein (TIGR01567 family)
MNQTTVLAKLLVEHGASASDKKTLIVGETWDIGAGYALTANSIDAKSSPRQVWITLSRDGVKKDDKVLTSGTSDAKPIYTYIERSLCGENDVPVLVTYVDGIFAGATSDMVQFRYTWLINPTCTRVKPGDMFGTFNTTIADALNIVLENTVPISLERDTVTNILNDVKFKVVDSDILRFYPVIGIPPATPACSKSLVMGYQFNDNNVDGLWDTSESGLANWTIRLSGKDSCTNSVIDRIAVTDIRGYYEFRDVPTGTYLVSEKIKNDWIPTTPGIYKIFVPPYVTMFRKDFGNIYNP